jgi:hypothetical protein
VLAAPASGQAEWVELYIADGAPFALQGWHLRRTSTGSGTVQEIDLSAASVAASGFALVELGSGALPNDGATLELFDAQGRLRDHIIYPALGSSQVYARAQDGADPWRNDYPPSPGAPNLPGSTSAEAIAAPDALPPPDMLPAPAEPAPEPDTSDTQPTAPPDAAGVLAAPDPTATPTATSHIAPALSSAQHAPGAAYQGTGGILYNYADPPTATPASVGAVPAAPTATPEPLHAAGAPARPFFDIGLFTGVLLLVFACGCALVVWRSRRERR